MTLYAERDIDEFGQHYDNHVSAMTAEGLNSKSAVVAELAYRDAEIARLRAALDGVVPKIKSLMRDEVVIAGIVNFVTIEEAVKQLRGDV